MWGKARVCFGFGHCDLAAAQALEAASRGLCVYWRTWREDCEGVVLGRPRRMRDGRGELRSEVGGRRFGDFDGGQRGCAGGAG